MNDAADVRTDAPPRADAEPVLHTLSRADGSTAARIVRNADGERILVTDRVLMADVLAGTPPGAVRRTLAKVFFRGGALEPRGETRRTEAEVLGRIATAVAARPGWCVRVYRLIDGLRVIAVHDVLPTDDADARRFLVELGIDAEIVADQLAGGSWRVRVSPAIERLRVGPPPAPGGDALTDWERRHDAAAARHASSHMLKRLGDERAVPETKTVVEIHDRTTRSASGLPLA
jgi:hypothetical protein